MIVLYAAMVASQVAGGSRLWRPEERVVLSDYSYVAAVAATSFSLYIATREGLAIYDRVRRSWKPPSSIVDGYPVSRVNAAMASPGDETVWLATDAGWARYQPSIQRWDRGALPGGAQGLALDRADQSGGVYLRSGGTWYYLPAFALLPIAGRRPPGGAIRPLTVAEALRANPTVDAMQGTLLRDQRLRPYRFTAAAQTADQFELFLGTDGIGLWAIDLGMIRADRLVFGLLARDAQVVTATADGVWTLAGNARTRRRGFVAVDAELQFFRWAEGQLTQNAGFDRAFDLLQRGDVVWAATDRGLLRLDTPTDRVQLFDMRDGLPANEVLALASISEGVVVGTRLGIAIVPDQDSRAYTPTAVSGYAVLALAAARDTVWVGMTNGLGVLLPTADRVLVPRSVLEVPRLRTPIMSLALKADTVIAATRNALFWRDPSTARWAEIEPRPPISNIIRVAVDARGVWIAGDAGVAFGTVRGERAWTLLPTGVDLPGRPADLAVTGRWLWVATEAGLVRFDRQTIIGP